ncbi:pentapeptide repeat-containing protein [Amycolatopsis sp. NPDC051758]|uniref:pentapeptide repeat-containing protein n=1 Tax=Amycolatopsis sp. NPDC051758 TaxID=3363935 RepID=UPI0037A051EF
MSRQAAGRGLVVGVLVLLLAAYVLAVVNAPALLLDEDQLRTTPGFSFGDRLAAEHNARVVLASLGGALVVALGLLFTGFNYALARRGHVSDRFTTALERIGATEEYVQSAGFRALLQIKRESSAHRDEVVQVVLAYIRRHARAGTNDVWTGLQGVASPDHLHEALTVLRLGPATSRRARTELDLARISYPGANLRGARLREANFRRAVLEGADLREAELIRADFRNALLLGARLERARLAGAKVGAADLTEAKLQEAVLTGASMVKAVLRSADLRFAVLVRAELGFADLRDATMWRAKLIKAKLPGAVLESAQLNEAWLTEANLSAARLSGVNLTRARMRRSQLDAADLSSANLAGADLRQANLFKADLDSADLRQADLRGANLDSANLRAANLRGADLRSTGDVRPNWRSSYRRLRRARQGNM